MKILYYPLLLILCLFALSCDEQEKESKPEFDYTYFVEHVHERMNMKVSLPNDYKIVYYTRETLDSLIKENSNDFDQWKLQQIAAIYKQQKGKTVTYYHEGLMSNIVFFPLEYIPINEETVKNIGYMLKYEMQEANKTYGMNFNLDELKMGSAGANDYAMYHISSVLGHNYQFTITQGYQTWGMSIFNDQVTDYQAVINTMKPNKKR